MGLNRKDRMINDGEGNGERKGFRADETCDRIDRYEDEYANDDPGRPSRAKTNMKMTLIMTMRI